jgi:hypothetical protein
VNRRPTTADAGTPGQPYPPPSWVLAASVGAALLDKLLATSDSSTSRRPLSTYATPSAYAQQELSDRVRSTDYRGIQ